MKKIVENIEKEIVELKKAIEDWEGKADLSVLKMAKRNLDHANDWMELLSERIEKAYHQMEAASAVTSVAAEAEMVVETLEEPSNLAAVNEEKDATDQSDEKETSGIEEGREEEQETVLEPAETIDVSLAVTACHFIEEEGDKRLEVKSEKTEYLLSQSYEEKAKHEQKNGDAMNETPILGEHLLKMENGIYASLSLNDSIRFSRAWFDEDNKELKHFLRVIEDAGSLEEGLSVAEQRLNADTESEEWLALVEMMNKYFND